MGEDYLLHKGDAASNKEFVEEAEKLLLYLKCTCKEHVFCSLCDCASLTFGFQEILRLRLLSQLNCLLMPPIAIRVSQGGRLQDRRTFYLAPWAMRLMYPGRA